MKTISLFIITIFVFIHVKAIEYGCTTGIDDTRFEGQNYQKSSESSRLGYIGVCVDINVSEEQDWNLSFPAIKSYTHDEYIPDYIVSNDSGKYGAFPIYLTLVDGEFYKSKPDDGFEPVIYININIIVVPPPLRKC